MKHLFVTLLVSLTASLSMALTPALTPQKTDSEQFILVRTCKYQTEAEKAEAKIFVNPFSKNGASGLIVFSASFLGRTSIASKASVTYYNSSRVLIREVAWGTSAAFVRIILNSQQTEAVITVGSEGSQLRTARATCE